MVNNGALLMCFCQRFLSHQYFRPW
jgi:hypothetical protein